MTPDTNATDVLVRLSKEEHEGICEGKSFYNRTSVLFSLSISFNTSITSEPNRTVAFADVHTELNNIKTGRIVLAVLPEMRELRLGTALTMQCLRKCKDFGIEKLIAKVPITNAIGALFFNTIFTLDKVSSNKDYFIFYKYINEVES